eukprot:GHVT01097981.1.p3 GENE.GHVT01097981.1~~GHVT01097981.1.p3  ORF type:complete len:102 (-),score=19.39 GHVT01097981.1:698-1003(-)
MSASQRDDIVTASKLCTSAGDSLRIEDKSAPAVTAGKLMSSTTAHCSSPVSVGPRDGKEAMARRWLFVFCLVSCASADGPGPAWQSAHLVAETAARCAPPV